MPHLSHRWPLLAAGLSLLAFTAPVCAETGAAASNGPDLLLLKRAIASAWSYPGLQADTEMRITVTGEGAAVTYRENVQIVAAQPNRYNSLVKLIKPDGSPGVVYRIVCDGKQVVSYRSGLNAYAVQPIRKFERQADDFPPLGLYVGALFFADHSFTALFDGLTSRNQNQATEMLVALGASLETSSDTLDGVPYTIYTLQIPKDGWTYRFFVQPRTAALSQIEMTSDQGPIKMMVLERIKSVHPVPPDPSAFQFTPPAGTERVSELPVSPFYDR